MGKKSFDRATIERAAELREQGLSYSMIEKLTGMSRGSAYWHCLREGAEAPNNTIRAGAIGAMVLTTKRGHTIRRYTEDEDQKILAMEALGANPTEIAKALGRARSSIIGRMMMLARHEERAANGLPPINAPREVA